MTKVSAFHIKKVLAAVTGDIKTAKKLKNGTVLIETKNALQASKIIQITKFLNIEVKVSEHRSLNNSRGVAYCPDSTTSAKKNC